MVGKQQPRGELVLRPKSAALVEAGKRRQHLHKRAATFASNQMVISSGHQSILNHLLSSSSCAKPNGYHSDDNNGYAGSNGFDQDYGDAEEDEDASVGFCPMCKRPFWKSDHPDYFAWLARIYGKPVACLAPSSPASFASGAGAVKLPRGLFNQGYFARFFRQVRLLGRGGTGSVWLVEHHLDASEDPTNHAEESSESLGMYAVKIVPIGTPRDLHL